MISFESSESLSFDPPADLYDTTRKCDSRVLDQALDALRAAFPPDAYGDLFEPGIGTGRIAIPLARKGYRVTGVDISPKMLARLEAKLSTASHPIPIDYQLADVTDLPVNDGIFDIAVIVHLLYFIPDWKRALKEICRVLRPQAPVVFLHTGTGAEVPRINDRYKAICCQQGYEIRNRGVASTAEAVDYLQSIGFAARRLDGPWSWETCISLRQALDYVAWRAYSFTLETPPAIHRIATETINSELRAEWGSLSQKVRIPNEIKMLVLQRGDEKKVT
jgi:ubiquinone/menaquinone biosynthesis C-methylase UbiE